MSNITNHYAEGSCVFEAGSSQNGDVYITGPVYQGVTGGSVSTQMEMRESADDGVANCDIIADGEELFHFIHPEVVDSEERKIHQAVKKLVKRFGVKEICEYLAKLAEEKKILLPQSVKNAYDELIRMGMSEGEGYAYKTFEKYYKR